MAKKNNYKHGKRTFSDLFTGKDVTENENGLHVTESEGSDVEMLETTFASQQDYLEEIEPREDKDSVEYEYVASQDHEGYSTAAMGSNNGEIDDYEEYHKTTQEMEVTVISPDTVIAGEINSNGHIEIYGNLNGNVKAKGNVRIYGQVAGDITGNNIELVSCKVRGNIKADATVQINHESVIAGNVAAADMILDGKLKGDVTLQRTTLFMENAVLFGNVYAGMISIKNGAKLYGEIQIENGNDDEAFADI